VTKAFGEWTPCVGGCLFVAAGMVGFASTAFRPLMVVLMLAGAVNAAGRSLQQPTISSLISKFSDPRDQGVVFGLFPGLARRAGGECLGLPRPVRPLQAPLVVEELRDVTLDPLVVEQLAHQHAAVAGVAHRLLQGVRALLPELLVLVVQRLLQRLVLQQQGVHGVGLLAAGGEQPAKARGLLSIL